MFPRAEQRKNQENEQKRTDSSAKDVKINTFLPLVAKKGMQSSKETWSKEENSHGPLWGEVRWAKFEDKEAKLLSWKKEF